MKLFLLLFWTSFACQNKDPKSDEPTKQEKTVNQKPDAKNPTPPTQNVQKSAESNVKSIIDTLIKNNKLDIMITKFEVENDSKKVQIEGSAQDNATVSVLLKGLEKDTHLQKVYLVKSETGKGNNEKRKVFSITAALSSK